MLSRGKWLAVVRDDHWIIAHVVRSKNNMKILRLADFDLAQIREDGAAGREPRFQETAPEEESKPASSADPARRLQQWLKQEKMSDRKLPIAFTCEGVITRIIVLPKLSRKDLHKLLTEQVDQYFSMNIEDYIVDYRVLEHFAEDGQPRMRVLLAALPKPQWEKFWQTCQSARLRPKVVELAADSIARMYVWGEGSSKNGRRFWPLRNSRMEFLWKPPNWLRKILPQKLPDVPHFKFNLLPDTLRFKFNLPLRRLKKDLSDENETLPDILIVSLNQGRFEFIILERGVFFLYSDYKPVWEEDGAYGFSSSSWENVLAPVFPILMEFNHFFASRHFGKWIDQIYLTGDFSDIPNIADLFEENLGIPTAMGFPKLWQPKFVGKAKAQQQNWMKFADLYGLALRED